MKFKKLTDTMFMAQDIRPPQTQELWELITKLQLDLGPKKVLVELDDMSLNAYFMFTKLNGITDQDLDQQSYHKVIIEFTDAQTGPSDAVAFKLSC